MTREASAAAGEEPAAAPSPFADKRGGPAVYTGVGYQTAWATLQALTAVFEEITSPGHALVLKLEPRVLVEGGQYGFDVGVDRDARTQLFEAKVNPSKQDVLGVMRTLEGAAQGERPAEVVLVAGAGGLWYTALADLRDNALEATSEEEFRHLIEAAGDVRRRDLFDALGDGPWEVARRLGQPLLMPPDCLDAQVRIVATMLCGSAKAEDLAYYCAARLSDASRRRESITVSTLAGEFDTRGLLQPVTPVPDDDDRVLHAVAVLSVCATPLPTTVLAAALEISEEELLGVLRRQIETGELVHDEESLFRPGTAYSVEGRYAGRSLEATLDRLLQLPGVHPASAVSQAYNTYLLCRLLVDERPDLVAQAFHAYDRSVKGTGSLVLVSALAERSLSAIARLARRDAGDQGEVHRLLWLRGHAQICGTTWVYQRVGQFERAAEEMIEARRDAEQYGHADNLAYADKCLGRIYRLRGEACAADGDHERAAALYEQSMDHLLKAHRTFHELVRAGGRYHDEPGECLSLAARTRLVAEDLNGAEDYSSRAHEELAGLPVPNKAVGDLVLLDVEVALARLDSNGPEGASEGTLSRDATLLSNLARQCRSVIDAFPVPVATKPGSINVGESEIRGRAQRLLGVVQLRQGRPTEAAGAFRAAADEFEGVQQMALSYDCALRALEAAGGLPDRLAALLDTADASVATRVEAHRLYEQDHAADRPVVFLEGLVRRARDLARLRDHQWGESAA